jgi:hypothetical protein
MFRLLSDLGLVKSAGRIWLVPLATDESPESSGHDVHLLVFQIHSGSLAHPIVSPMKPAARGEPIITLSKKRMLVLLRCGLVADHRDTTAGSIGNPNDEIAE